MLWFFFFFFFFFLLTAGPADMSFSVSSYGNLASPDFGGLSRCLSANKYILNISSFGRTHQSIHSVLRLSCHSFSRRWACCFRFERLLGLLVRTISFDYQGYEVFRVLTILFVWQFGSCGVINVRNGANTSDNPNSFKNSPYFDSLAAHWTHPYFVPCSYQTHHYYLILAMGSLEEIVFVALAAISCSKTPSNWKHEWIS